MVYQSYQIILGFFPGNTLSPNKSAFLEDLDRSTAREGKYVVSMWSHGDEVIKYDCLVYGKYTPRIKG